MQDQFKRLLSPLQVGPKTIRNRVLMTAHIPGLESDGKATDGYIAYHARRARGGAGLQMSGASGFHHTGHPSSGRGLDLTRDGVVPTLRKLADALHEHGGMFLLQMAHATATGDYGDIGQPLWAPSPVASDILKVMPKEMNRQDIASVISAYGRGAGMVREAGLDGVELLAAFGYLPGSFFSPVSNQRSDEYGGSVRNRVRFALEAIKAAREAAGPDLIVGIRMPGDEKIDGGLDNEALAEIAGLLAESGALDYINVAAGTNNDRIMRWEHWPASPAPHGLFAPLAATIRKAVNIPVFVTGRVTDPAMAEQILARGEADMVGMTRAHIADPDIVSKIRSGSYERIRRCVGANVCIARATSGKVIRCFQNPEAAREQETGGVTRTARPRRVAVIGGGPAGMEAARRAAANGHQAVVYEATGQLGGQLRQWSASPFAREYIAAVEWLERELAEAQVQVRYNSPVGEDELAGIEADAVILATGSVPLEPRALPGADASGIRLATAADVIGGAAGRGARHAVIAEEGGGRNGLAAAEVLAEAGVRVTIVSGDMAIAEHINGTVRTQLYRFLLNRDVVFRPMEKVTGFEPGRVLTRNIYTRAEGVIEDVDLFVDWRGNQVNAALEDALRARFAEVHVIGDCLAPRTVQLAIAEGTAAADALG
jgi:2,4-dienoyl-CoA reductase-like NADH-dependent reductase (Old Yellow Enzyme family)